MPPTTLSFRCSRAELRMGVADFSFATLSITFCRIALSSGSPGLPEAAFTAGVRLVTREGRWPGSVVLSLSDLIVAPTAPQASWPSTMISGVPSMACIFHAGNRIVFGEVTRHAANEQVASATIEGIFGRDARVGATQDAGVGILS